MEADLIFINGPVLTVDKDNTIAEAVAVKDDKIVYVGSKDGVAAFQGEKTEVVDLKGRSLTPGFIDSHLHLGVLGMNSLAIDCRYPYVKSVEDIKEKIREMAKVTPKGQWIRGWGYDHTKLAENRHPNKWDLDEAAPDNPVMLTRCCAHISTHNSRSLELMGVDDTTPSPAGGLMERDEQGRLTGVMKENAHMQAMKVAMPTDEELLKAFEVASNDLVKEGITSLHDSGGYGPKQMRLEEQAVRDGVIKQRVNAMIFSFVDNIDFVESYIAAPEKASYGDHKFRIGPAKLMIDGSSSGPTAATLEPYCSNPNDYGILSMEQEKVDDIILRAHKAGYQVTCHAVGDRAVKTILSAIEKALKAYPKENHRHRVEHCAIINDELLTKIKELKIVPVPQPIFFYEFGDGYMVNYGKERVDHMFTCKSYIDNGIIAAGSSDCPITFSYPLLGIHLAVNRTTQTGQKISQNERITKEQALRMFTYNGAYASFEEDFKGSIEVGKAADLAVLSESYFDCADEGLKDIKIDMTVIDGKIVYRR